MAANIDLIRAAIQRAMSDLKSELEDLDRQLAAFAEKTSPLQERRNAVNFALGGLQKAIEACGHHGFDPVKGGGA